MQMDRDTSEKGVGKYALINLRKVKALKDKATVQGSVVYDKTLEALRTLENAGVLEWGAIGDSDEFFVIKLKDTNAKRALTAYADQAEATDPQWAQSVRSLVTRSSEDSPYCKQPD